MTQYPQFWWRVKNPEILRFLIVMAGIVIGQFVLYWPSLLGLKVLLPLDILEQPQYLIPSANPQWPENYLLTDLVLQNEPNRRFVASELRAGRFPFWNPYQFMGVPQSFMGMSPFVLLSALSESPCLLPWVELLAALIAGLGAYVFCRKVLHVAFWSAAIVAWCYPLTGHFILFQGIGMPFSVIWLPWILFLTYGTVRRDGRFFPIGLAIVTGLVLISGKLDMAGQVMLCSGLFAIWSYFDRYGKEWFSRQACTAGLILVAAWGLGFGLGSSGLFPLLDYASSGARLQARGAGTHEDRPPVGLEVLPQIVLPDIFGSGERDSYPLPIFEKVRNMPESPASGYAGLIAVFFVAPLAWSSRKHRSINLFWIGLAVLGVGWSINLPGLVQILRLPGLNMMSHNRLVFASAFAFLALAAVGLDELGKVQRRRWFWIPFAVLAGITLWCSIRTFLPPEPIRTELEAAVHEGKPFFWVKTLVLVAEIKAWYFCHYLAGAFLALLGCVGWLNLLRRRRSQSWLMALTGGVMFLELLWFAHGRRPQCDSALYYPKIGALEQIRSGPAGRVLGYNCLPAAIPQVYGLTDVRGYDAVDPVLALEILSLARRSGGDFSYARVQWFEPLATPDPPAGVKVSPILDMLGVRYLILRKQPAGEALFQSNDYWVLLNRSALSRAFVPRRVESSPGAVLEKLSDPAFNPSEVAYLEVPTTLSSDCRGAVQIVQDQPGRIRLLLNMETAGLIVLADLWDKGWRAYLNGQPVPILRTNHALRGVEAPAGKGVLEFSYEPAAVSRALLLTELAAMCLLVWTYLAQRGMRQKASAT